MRELTFTFGCPYSGSGLGAWGVQQGSIVLPNLGVRARWEYLGGIDIDPLACADAELLTGVPHMCRDMRELRPADLRAYYGERAPCTSAELGGFPKHIGKDGRAHG